MSKKASQKTIGSMIKNRFGLVMGIIILLLIPLFLLLVRNTEKNSHMAIYQDDTSSFSYPKEWTIRKMAMSNIQGTELFLQPPNAAEPKTPHVIIEVAAANPTSLSDMTDPFTIFHYTKTDAVVSGMHVQKYTNVVHAAEGVLHSTAYVFEAKGNIYLIELGYKQQQSDPQLENDFLQILTSFVPK